MINVNDFLKDCKTPIAKTYRALSPEDEKVKI